MKTQMKKIDFGNIILVFLIISALFLTGSLWFDNYHGLSLVIAKLPFWLTETFDFNKIEYTEYVKPFKITVTNGESGNYSYYAFNNGNYAGFEIIQNIIMQIPEETIIENAFSDEWNELKNRKSIICEFGNGIDVNILKSVIPAKTFYNTNITNISAIAITKSVNGVIIYINEENTNFYRVSINKEIPEFINYIEEYSNKMTYTKLVKLEEMGTTTFYGNKKISQDSRVLFPVSTKQNNRRQVSEIIKKPFHNTHDIDEIEKIVKDFFATYEYTKFTTTDDSYIFIKDDGSTIKIFNNGILEYTSKAIDQYVESTIISSFDMALKCISDINSTENIYLLSAKKVDDYYQFEFGINMEDLPVIDTNNRVNEDNRVHIHVKVKNNKIIYYKELLDRYESRKTTSYISGFGHNILDDVLVNIDKDTTVTIENLELVYDIANNNTLPVWFTTYKTTDKSEFILTSAAKKRNY